MRFDREPWVKLYKHEGPQHRLMSLEARAFRDFLLRFAKSEDGVILESSKAPFRDLCRVVAADSREEKKIKKWAEELIGVGYLNITKEGKITVARFVEAQTARSKNAERQARWKEKQRQRDEEEETLPDSVSSNAQITVSGNAQETLHKEEMRRDEKRDSKLSGGLASRLVTFERTAGSPPSPRKDPMFEMLPFARWFPSQQWLDWAKESGLPNNRFDETIVEARNKLTGTHDIEWWDMKILRFFEAAMTRHGSSASNANRETVLSP